MYSVNQKLGLNSTDYIKSEPDIASYTEHNYMQNQDEVHINSLLQSKFNDFVIIKKLPSTFKNEYTEVVYHSQVIEVGSDFVILNCIIDEKKNISQRRKFDLEPMKGVLDLFEGENVKITVRTCSGERRFIYEKDDINLTEDIAERDYFSKYIDSSFFPK